MVILVFHKQRKKGSVLPVVNIYLNFFTVFLMLFVSSAARYQNELAGVEAEQLAERFYHQALSVMPHVGE